MSQKSFFILLLPLVALLACQGSTTSVTPILFHGENVLHACIVDGEVQVMRPDGLCDEEALVHLLTTSQIHVREGNEEFHVPGGIHSPGGGFYAGQTTGYLDGRITLSKGTNLEIDGETLFIRNENNRVGIGTKPSSLLHVSAGNAGDAQLILEADKDNNNENDNPFITFKQDGNRANAFMGLEGVAGNRSTGTLANALVIGSEDNNPAVQFVTNDQVRMTITTGGNVEVSGTLAAADIVYQNPETRYLMLGAASFNTGGEYYNSGGRAYPREQDRWSFTAPIHLPQGAKIVGFEATVKDLNPNFSISVRLYRYTRDGSGHEIAELSSAFTTGVHSFATSTLSEVIDNESFSYHVEATGWIARDSDAGLDLIDIRSARITYVVDRP